MTIPATAIAFLDPMDPSDVRDYVLDLGQLLEEGEAFTDIVVAAYPESTALGFEIRSDGAYAPAELSNSQVRLWFQVAAPNRSDPVWDSGKQCAIEATAVTDSIPPRTYQRTAVVTVVQR